MSVILTVIGLLFVAYGGWMGWRLAQLASLSEGPDVLGMYFGMPGGIVLICCGTVRYFDMATNCPTLGKDRRSDLDEDSAWPARPEGQPDLAPFISELGVLSIGGSLGSFEPTEGRNRKSSGKARVTASKRHLIANPATMVSSTTTGMSQGACCRHQLARGDQFLNWA